LKVSLLSKQKNTGQENVALLMKNEYNIRTINMYREAKRMGFSDFLFARPSFFSGMTAALDIGATLTVYNDSKSPTEADIQALRADWRAVGKDVSTAIESYEQTCLQAK
jgi:hypothetical protein